MPKKIVAAFGLELERKEINRGLASVQGMTVHFFTAADILDADSRRQALEKVQQLAAAVLIKNNAADVSLEHCLLLLEQASLAIPVIPLGSAAIGQGIGNIDAGSIEKINQFFIYGGLDNITAALLYIQAKILEGRDEGGLPEPRFMPFDGIFHPRIQTPFTALDEYLAWYDIYRRTASLPCRKGRIGLLVNRGSWLAGELDVEKALIAALEKAGFWMIPVFSHGTREEALNSKSFEELLTDYLYHDKKLFIDALINLQIFVFTDHERGANIMEEAAQRFAALNIPVFRPLISYAKSITAWQEGMEGLVTEIPWSFTAAEMQGMIEPIIIGCRDRDGRAVPIAERIDRLAARIGKWMNLRFKANEDKRLAVFIHNAPCSGAEATVGLGAGLDVFASVVTVLKALRDEGWRIDDIPADGKALQNVIMTRKAYSDFRWTSPEDIVHSGGCIYQMPLQGEKGYLTYYGRLDPDLRKQMESTWGRPPGEGMVLNQNLVITGLQLDRAVIMVQPKRGCCGAKCNGEVCKILQDPLCPPPHQYLAAYKYAEEIFGADAVLHVGTHGSLEFLPGKTNALSARCFPDAVLGSLPHLYIYNTGVGTEAVMAKRRSHALTVGHLPSVYRGADDSALHLIELISEYFAALAMNGDQAPILEKQIREGAAGIKGAAEILAGENTVHEGLLQLKSTLVQSLSRPAYEKPHHFGMAPGKEDALEYIREVFEGDYSIMACLEQQGLDDYSRHLCLRRFIAAAVAGNAAGSAIAREIMPFAPDQSLSDQFDHLAGEVRHIYAALQMSEGEKAALLNALKGGNVRPGPAGMPADNGKNILPTGRNLYLMNVDKVPTRAAYETGIRLAEALVALYMREEGIYPEKVAMNLISLDITRSRGEQLSQVLYLLGIMPVWDRYGKVAGLKAIGLEQLKRPRIDVTVRITGVLRDSYPEIIALLDQAAIMAANLPEPEEFNYVRKHSRQIAKALQEGGVDEQVERRSTLRVFGDKPGTYGAGVDLALKSSAWKNERDLARTFIYFSSYAYGTTLYGQPARKEFAENVVHADISYDQSGSKRCDLFASSFGASVQGGFGLLKKVLQGGEIKQYHGCSENRKEVQVRLLREKLGETLERTLFNPLWRENIKEQGYEGGAQFMHRLQNVFEWQCVTGQVEDAALNRLAEDYINDPRMQVWFKDNNPFALEEAARRFLELHQRGKWQADPGVLDRLRHSYLAVEGDMEERTGDMTGDIQAGGIDIITADDIAEWKNKWKDADDVLKSR